MHHPQLMIVPASDLALPLRPGFQSNNTSVQNGTPRGQTLQRTAMYTADVMIIIVPIMDNAFGTEWKKRKSLIVA